MDRRLISISAQVRSQHIKRENALDIISSNKYPLTDQMKIDKEYIAKKLSISDSEFEKLLSLPNKSFKDYKTYYPLLRKLRKLIKFLSKIGILPILYHDDKYS